jgi:hypothetical protein
MTTPTTASRWPTPYILDIYNSAVTHGYVRIESLTAEQAKSLTQTIYRFRRRSDTGKAAFMRPEFQLITVSQWHCSDETTGLGYVHVVYSNDPDQQLPKIITPPPKAGLDMCILADTSAEPTPIHNISDFVSDMLAKSQQKG